VFPEVENPIPETIGLGTIFSAAGAAGILALVLAVMLGQPDTRRNKWVMRGTLSGFALASAFYALALLVQLFCRQ
jgi:hypothetical protein